MNRVHVYIVVRKLGDTEWQMNWKMCFTILRAPMTKAPKVLGHDKGESGAELESNAK